MPEFMDIHRGMVGITAEGLKEAHAADLAIQAEEGESAEAIQRIHESAAPRSTRSIPCR